MRNGETQSDVSTLWGGRYARDYYWCMRWVIAGRWFLAINILLMWAMFFSHLLIAFFILGLCVCIYGLVVSCELGPPV